VNHDERTSGQCHKGSFQDQVLKQWNQKEKGVVNRMNATFQNARTTDEDRHTLEQQQQQQRTTRVTAQTMLVSVLMNGHICE
jgi:hypothetical protein